MVTRGEYRFSSLVKKKKEKKYAVLYFTGKRNIFFCVYDVITWGEKKALLITTYVDMNLRLDPAKRLVTIYVSGVW
jgi:hypothetical protein